MDYSIFYIIGIVVGILTITFIGNFLFVKYPIKKEYLDLIKIVFNLTESIIDELDLKREKEIKQIINITKEALNFVANTTGTYEEVFNQAKKFAYYLCEKTELQLTENRINIINTLLEQGLKGISKENY